MAIHNILIMKNYLGLTDLLNIVSVYHFEGSVLVTENTIDYIIVNSIFFRIENVFLKNVNYT